MSGTAAGGGFIADCGGCDGGGGCGVWLKAAAEAMPEMSMGPGGAVVGPPAYEPTI